MKHVPVRDSEGKPLMPTSGKRARKLMERGDAKPFWSGGVFGIQLTREPSARNMQDVVVAVDPGSKREAYTVKSQSSDYLNITADAVDWVGKKLESRRILRRARRQRNTPYRSPKRNNDRPDRIPAGTRARWEWKLRLLDWLSSMYPVTRVIVDDIAAATNKGKRRWNSSFSPLAVGKKWFYEECEKRWPLTLVRGYETAALRKTLRLRKTSQKLKDTWSAHCVDTWAMAWSWLGGKTTPEHYDLLRIIPIQRQRRCLHRANPSKGGVRRKYGGTNKGCLKTATLVQSPKYGLCYTGGSDAPGRVSLHSIQTGKRIAIRQKVAQLQIMRPIAFRVLHSPA